MVRERIVGGGGGKPEEECVLISEIVIRDKDGGEVEGEELLRVVASALKVSKANAALTTREVQEDVHRIIDTGYFASCLPTAEDTQDGVRLIFQVGLAGERGCWAVPCPSCGGHGRGPRPSRGGHGRGPRSTTSLPAFAAGSGATSQTAQLSFTLDSGASSCFFRNYTNLTPLRTPVTVALADPSVGPVVAHSTTTLPCPTAPSGFLTGYYTPRFSRNLVGVSHLHDLGVVTTFSLDEPVASCTVDATGAPLATFHREPGASGHFPQGAGLWSPSVACPASLLACATVHSLRRGSAARCPSLLLVPPHHGSLPDPALGRLGPLPVALPGSVATSCLSSALGVRRFLPDARPGRATVFCPPRVLGARRFPARRAADSCTSSAPGARQNLLVARPWRAMDPTRHTPRARVGFLPNVRPERAAVFSPRTAPAAREPPLQPASRPCSPRACPLQPAHCPCSLRATPAARALPLQPASRLCSPHAWTCSRGAALTPPPPLLRHLPSACVAVGGRVWGWRASHTHRGSGVFSPPLFLTLEPPPVAPVAHPPSHPAPAGVSHVTPQSSPPQRPVPVVYGGEGGAVAEGEGAGAAGAGGVGSGGAGGVGVEVTPVEDTAASTRRPRPASPPGFPSVLQFPPLSSLRPVAAEPGGVPAGGSGGPGGVGGGGARSGSAGAGGTGTVGTAAAAAAAAAAVGAGAGAVSVAAARESRGGATTAARESRGGVTTAAAGAVAAAVGESRGGVTATPGEGRATAAAAAAAPAPAAAVAAATATAGAGAVSVAAAGESSGGATGAAQESRGGVTTAAAGAVAAAPGEGRAGVPPAGGVQESRSQQRVQLQPQQNRAEEEPQEQQQGQVTSQQMPEEAEQQRLRVRDLPDPAHVRLVRGPLLSPLVPPVPVDSSFSP
ncbi:unnamed protein product [Closterium sp. NIES-54]